MATVAKLGIDLTDEDTLVGDAGGTSVIYEITPSVVRKGLLAVDTEHGILYLDPQSAYNCLM